MNLSIFMMAGSESTSISLAVLLHVLASFPEEQEKLMDEIDSHFPSNSDVNSYPKKNKNNIQLIVNFPNRLSHLMRIFKNCNI